ncbi:alpha/beta fold hydrolase [Nonomuraea sp. NPDC050383]|uniref:alpha/beta fold hydrolase n=1 Tax=Nonomuraea sp. NPDC050383 TaxID=3364362 RepID=UPI003799319F
MSYLQTRQVRFQYTRAGSGPPVLLIPGSGGWKLTFHAMMRRLARHHTVYALDPPGQGATEIANPLFPDGTDAIVDSIVEFLDAVSLRHVAVVGHSWGGGFALRLAELHPERVTRLALIAPGGLDVKDVWEFRLMRLPILGDLAVRLVSKTSLRHMLRKSFVHRDRLPDDDLVDEAVKAIRTGSRSLAMLRIERAVSWIETERDLHLVDVPVLLLWGERDRYFPVSLIDRFTTRLTSVAAHVLPDAGHSLHDDSPEHTYALLEPFLRGTADQR